MRLVVLLLATLVMSGPAPRAVAHSGEGLDTRWEDCEQGNPWLRERIKPLDQLKPFRDIDQCA